MKTYSVTGIVTGNKFLGYFKVDSPEKAIELALGKSGGPVSLCHQCAGECEDATIEKAIAELLED